MKTQTRKNFPMLSLVLMLTAVSVCAQSERSKVTKIPFSFIVGQKTLPAGEYTVEPNRKDSHNVWLIQRRDGSTSALFTTMPLRSNEIQEKAKLIFHKYGDQYFLSQIWTPGSHTGRELLMPRLERELAKNPIERRTIVLAIGPAGSQSPDELRCAHHDDGRSIKSLKDITSQ